MTWTFGSSITRLCQAPTVKLRVTLHVTKPFQGHQGSFVRRGLIFLGELRGMDVTAADVFEAKPSETSGANLIAGSDGGIVQPRARVSGLKEAESEIVRGRNAGSY